MGSRFEQAALVQFVVDPLDARGQIVLVDLDADLLIIPVFQEDNLGAIQPGKLADLVVLDRDYLTIPADQIKDIKPVLTMVDGRIVYDASTATATR